MKKPDINKFSPTAATQNMDAVKASTEEVMKEQKNFDDFLNGAQGREKIKRHRCKGKIINLVLESGLLDPLDAIAEKEFKSRSVVLREAISMYLKVKAESQ